MRTHSKQNNRIPRAFAYATRPYVAESKYSRAFRGSGCDAKVHKSITNITYNITQEMVSDLKHHTYGIHAAKRYVGASHITSPPQRAGVAASSQAGPRTPMPSHATLVHERHGPPLGARSASQATRRTPALTGRGRRPGGIGSTAAQRHPSLMQDGAYR